MIGSILIKLKTEEEFKIIGRGEKALHDFVLDVIKRENKDLAREIDHEKAEKPITISPFLKGVLFKAGHSWISPKESSSFRLTYLKAGILEPVMKAFFSLSSKKEAVKLGDGKASIEKVDMQKATQAIFTSFEKLLTQGQTEERIFLEFCSPTSFSTQREERLFPLPEHVFSSLLKKWNTFSGRKYPLQGEKDFQKIGLIRYRLKTENIFLGKDKIIGFMGKAGYQIPQTLGKEMNKTINVLSNFAFYSGVGIHTAMGMGQVRRTKK